MQLGILLAVLGGIIGLIGPMLLPFITLIEEDANIPGWQTAPGVAAILFAGAALAAAALVTKRRRLQGLGGVIGALSLGNLALMAWTWADVWALVPCESSGLALCDATNGTLMAETLVQLDWGVAAVVTGAIASFVGGMLVLLAHPEFGRNERFLRVRMSWQGSALAEKVCFRRGVVSVGEDEGATFLVPAAGIGVHALLSPAGAGAWLLRAPAVGAVELLRRGEIVTLPPGESIEIERGDVGVLRLVDDLALSFDFMAAETAVLSGDQSNVWELLAPLAAVTTLALAFLLTGALAARGHKRDAFAEGLADRHDELIELSLLDDVPEPEPELPDSDVAELAPTARRAEGEEGRLGDLDAPERPTKVPKMNAEQARRVNVRELGVAAALSGPQAPQGALGEVLTGDTDRMETKLAAATAGEGSEFRLGRGHDALGFRDLGSGGGDPRGKVGIHGLGDIDTGPDVGRRARVGTGNKRRVRVATPVIESMARTPTHCDRGDIVKQVKRSASRLRACYEAELLHRPALRGKVTTLWTIDSGGRATSARVVQSTLGNRRVEDCVLRAVERLRFAKPEAGICVVQWPFVFEAH